MRIENLSSGTEAGRWRVAADLIWEECERGVERIWFDTAADRRHALAASPEAFLVAAAIPASHFGERRIACDEAVCPDLLDGTGKVLRLMARWYGGTPPQLEIPGRPAPRQPPRERSGLFFSGGLDSFAALCRNRLIYGNDHPGTFRDGLLIYGLEMDDPAAFERVAAELAGAAEVFELDFVTVYTNVYLNYRAADEPTRFRFWREKFMGSALAATAHALAPRLDRVGVAGDLDVATLQPHGSHPLVEPYFSSYDLQVRYENVELSRLDKLRLVADWPAALDRLRVCNQFRRYRPGELNCGRCEKCLRTMLGLLALGRLDQARAFAADDVDAGLLSERLRIDSDYRAQCYRDLVEPLRAIGRRDLVAVIERRLTRYQFAKSAFGRASRAMRGIGHRARRQFRTRIHAH